ncbi:MAG: hypothetical protein ACLFUU_13385 [Desulfobacteraceae bacterium]
MTRPFSKVADGPGKTAGVDANPYTGLLFLPCSLPRLCDLLTIGAAMHRHIIWR